jgi:hypothetical protein
MLKPFPHFLHRYQRIAAEAQPLTNFHNLLAHQEQFFHPLTQMRNPNVFHTLGTS